LRSRVIHSVFIRPWGSVGSKLERFQHYFLERTWISG
jgi:hypothetical protein